VIPEIDSARMRERHRKIVSIASDAGGVGSMVEAVYSAGQMRDQLRVLRNDSAAGSAHLNTI